MSSLIERFRSAKVLVIGDVMLDEYVVGTVSRICPEAPVPVLDVKSRFNSAGGAANVAMNVAGLGASVQLIGLASNDSAGKALRQLLAESGISDIGFVDAEDRGTISKIRIVAGQQQICRIDHECKTPTSSRLMDKLIGRSKDLIRSNSIIVLSDYAKGVLCDSVCASLIQFAHAAGKSVIVDPKSRSFRKYLGCSVITPNVAEASLAVGINIESVDSLHQAGKALAEQLPATNILITRGPEGMALFENGAAAISVPTTARKVFDVVGAGDTVVATLAVALAAGYPLREAVCWSNSAAGLVVEKPGTASIQIEELAKRGNHLYLGTPSADSMATETFVFQR